MIVTKVADDDVFDKIDIQFISSRFEHILNVGVTFMCTRYEQGDDEWIDPDGNRQIAIRLPYEEVKRSADVRGMMVAKLSERLGRVA